MSFQRRFEPGLLPGAGSTPHTGEWVDGFGNPVQVLAVVQPQCTRADFQTAYPGYLGKVGDRRLKNEGYGIVRVDPAARRFVIECWRWDGDPTAPETVQYPGFLHVLGFDEV